MSKNIQFVINQTTGLANIYLVICCVSTLVRFAIPIQISKCSLEEVPSYNNKLQLIIEIRRNIIKTYKKVQFPFLSQYFCEERHQLVDQLQDWYLIISFCA